MLPVVCGGFFEASRLVGPLVPYKAHSISMMAMPTQATMNRMGYALLSENIGAGPKARVTGGVRERRPDP